MVIVRDTPGGTLGIAVDLWDGEVTVGAISTGGPADREGTLVQGDVIKGKPVSRAEFAPLCWLARRASSIAFSGCAVRRLPGGGGGGEGGEGDDGGDKGGDGNGGGGGGEGFLSTRICPYPHVPYTRARP